MIDQTIRKMCTEVKKLEGKRTDWRLLSEEALFYEIAVCIFGSQMLYEHALALADAVKKQGMLRRTAFEFGFNQYTKNLTKLFSQPIAVEKGGSTQFIMPRFKNRLPKLLSESAQNIYGKGLSLRFLLLAAPNAFETRELLVDYISGFGPKQASLFLRRVGYCSNLAILDTHILDYLRLVSDIEIKQSSLSKLKWYETVESEFKRIARDFGYDVACVDLATWITMRVAKRECLV